MSSSSLECNKNSSRKSNSSNKISSSDHDDVSGRFSGHFCSTSSDDSSFDISLQLMNRDNPFFSGIDATPDIRLASRKKSIPLVSELVLKTMAATKRNAGLTSAVPRASLNDEELVNTRDPSNKLILYPIILFFPLLPSFLPTHLSSFHLYILFLSVSSPGFIVSSFFLPLYNLTVYTKNIFCFLSSNNRKPMFIRRHFKH